MRSPAWPELLRLPEEEAGHEYLSFGNRLHQRWMLAAAMVAAAVTALVHVIESDWLGAAPWLGT